ncbi:MAG: hypothetical protein IKY41_09550 [Clostridia bacterium]|nr:hypothetical protein [Clostridia bacterium]
MIFESPSDTINRKLYTQMTKSEIIKETKSTIQKLNRRIARLEKSGLADYSKSLTRMRNYLKEEFGTKRFSSKHLINASFEERVNFLTQIKHFESYHIMVGDVKKQIANELETIRHRTEISLTQDQLLILNKAMEKYRTVVGNSELSNYIDSNQVREILTDYTMQKFSQEEMNNFFDDLQNFLQSDHSEYIRDFLHDYDPNYRAPVSYTDVNGLPYNSVTYHLFDEWHEETQYEVDPATESLYDNNGRMFIIDDNGEMVEIK